MRCSQRKGEGMKKRRLGKDGDEVSIIGLGAWPIGGGMGQIDESQAIATIHAAIDLGITLIDTAQAYRSSEITIGKALGGGKRAKVFLASKASTDYSPRGIRSSVEDTLKALGTEYLDLYQIHSWNPQYPIEASMEEMARLVREGKTRFIGVSNFTVEQMKRAWAAAPFSSTQPAYNVFERDIERDVVRYCSQQGIGILAHSVLAKGLLTGKYRPDHRFLPDDERAHMPRFQGHQFVDLLKRADALSEVADEVGCSLVELSIAWVVRIPQVTCALVGAKTPSQVAEQVRAAEIVLNHEVTARIEDIASGRL